VLATKRHKMHKKESGSFCSSCAFLWQLLASEHSRALKQESLLRLHHTCPIISTQ